MIRNIFDGVLIALSIAFFAWGVLSLTLAAIALEESKAGRKLL